jgi:acetoin utilization protein AcuB
VVDIPDIGSVMTPFPHSIDAGAFVEEARLLLEDRGIRHLPVTSERKLVGIVTDRDVKLALDPLLGVAPPRRVRDIMTDEPYVVGSDEPLDNVLLEMAERRIGCAIVASRGAVQGIFTTTDATRLLGEHYRSLSGDARESRGKRSPPD